MKTAWSSVPFCLWLCLFVVAFFCIVPGTASAINLSYYSDTLSDSGPEEPSNHTFAFTPTVAIPASSVLEFDFPTGFDLLATSTFGIRNVEMLVNGVVRNATASPGFGIDGVALGYGDGGSVTYTLASNVGIGAGESVVLRVGNHSTRSIGALFSFSTSTGTTTLKAADAEPVHNPAVLGRHDIPMTISNGSVISNGDFIVFLVNKVRINVDTTEEIPPFRFNGTPTTTIGGTTLNVEIGLETDELANCRYSTVSGTTYAAMTSTFSNTGFLVHTTVVAVTQGALNTFYVRCIDDEGNFNVDDYLIQFAVNNQPTGTSNTEGETDGTGTGTGNDGSGDGSGSGGTTGDSDGEASTTGGSSGGGGGGSGGSGGGGGNGDEDDNSAGGGFESTNGPYQSGDGRVIISGIAFPGSRVNAIVDGYLAETVTANSNGTYSITIDEIARGAYTFGVFATGDNSVQSSVFSTSFTVTGARTSNLSNINISPSILVNPDPVDIGQTLTFSGYSLPNASVSIENAKEKSNIIKNITTTSNASGFWSVEVDTGTFSRGTYQVRAKSEQSSGVVTKFSDYTFYGVGEEASGGLFADLNRDGFVNLIDFSILLFWWSSDGGDSDPPADINQDGTVSLTDFSILLFNWTG